MPQIALPKQVIMVTKVTIRILKIKTIKIIIKILVKEGALIIIEGEAQTEDMETEGDFKEDEEEDKQGAEVHQEAAIIESKVAGTVAIQTIFNTIAPTHRKEISYNTSNRETYSRRRAKYRR